MVYTIGLILLWVGPPPPWAPDSELEDELEYMRGQTESPIDEQQEEDHTG